MGIAIYLSPQCRLMKAFGGLVSTPGLMQPAGLMQPLMVGASPNHTIGRNRATRLIQPILPPPLHTKSSLLWLTSVRTWCASH